MKRWFDILLSALLLVLSSPFVAIGALGVVCSSPGPIFYRAQRVGRYGRKFTMYKLRTMHVGSGPVITAGRDPRVFAFGDLLRKSKIDELPQLWNVLRGDMSMVGPRPEDPSMVEKHYTDWMLETLDVRPGITSLGAVFYYTGIESDIDAADPERDYVENILPAKLAVERSYMDRATFFGDLRCIALTAQAILSQALGLQMRLPARDLEGVDRWMKSEAVSG